MSDSTRYDVVILGSGLEGTVLAAILAKQGRRVLLLEKGTHPRFAAGEAMPPQTSMLLWILGARFGVPEIQYLSNTRTMTRKVTPMCGVQRSTGFVYHQDGRRQDPRQSHLLVPPVTPLTSESHLYRQDVDLYLLNAAEVYGADYRDKTEVARFEIRADGVRLWTGTGDEIRARFLVDGSSYRSPVAGALGLREEPSRLRTRSRTIFTYFYGVRPYDETLRPGESPGCSARWSEGTLHHVFDGGWFWVIPFDNHAEAKNPLCSIGLTLDMDKYPDTGQPPEREFLDFVDRFPSVATHFAGAEPVMRWMKTGRLQYSGTSSVAPRTFLLAHAYGFVDALYSRGLIRNFETIHALAPRLLQALEDDDFSPERFAYPDRLQAALLDANDRMVHNSYVASSDFRLWSSWSRVWLASELFGDVRLFNACLRFLETHDEAVLARLDEDPLPGAATPGEDAVQDLLRAGERVMAKAAAGEIALGEAADGVLAAVRGASWLPPVHGWADPESRHLDLLPDKLERLIGWGKTVAPPSIRRTFEFDPAILGALAGTRREAARPAGLSAVA